MYLVAQRVRRPATGEEGVNAYFYAHGAYVWQGPPPDGVPERNPGNLMNSNIEVPPPGNRVRSYLDIVAPDETPWTEIREHFVAFATVASTRPLPWRMVRGRCLFRVDMEAALATSWQSELVVLYQAAQAARVGG